MLFSVERVNDMQINIEDAKSNLLDLIDAAINGKEIL
jgi:antitoxin (DNA-binding transcriptional repressor) of toxin-antitoxin stability system